MLPLLLDVHAVAVLAHNVPAAALAAKCLHEVAADVVQLQRDMSGTSERQDNLLVAWALCSLPGLPGACSIPHAPDSKEELLQCLPEPHEATMQQLQELHSLQDMPCAEPGHVLRALQLAQALSQSASQLLGTADNAATQAYAALLQMHSVVALQIAATALRCCSSQDQAAMVQAVVQGCGALPSAQPLLTCCEQAVLLLAVQVADAAYEVIEAALKRSSGSGSQLGRWTLVSLLLHAGKLSLQLFSQLGLGM